MVFFSLRLLLLYVPNRLIGSKRIFVCGGGAKTQTGVAAAYGRDY